jgi:hypothetical protein
MHRTRLNVNQLPSRDLETIGLAADGQLLLNEEDLNALLSRRRTGLVQLHNLEAENIKIKSMDVKISVKTNAAGGADLLIHPIYKKPATPDFLDDFEAKQLENGKLPSLLKITNDGKGNKKELLVEYDKATPEFIISDTEKILAPDLVNGYFLAAAQKDNYRKGKEVKLPDGTSFNYTATDSHGIRSNKLALIASILIDGGLSYMLYRGLNAMFNQKRDENEAAKLSPAYYNAVRDMEEQQNQLVTGNRENNSRTVKR